MKDDSVSMAKGTAIILMALAHTMFSSYGVTFINMFHMPLFFFMSGYCFKEAYLTKIREYSWKRIKGAYWPYVKWGTLFLLLHIFFFSINIYNDEYGFRGVVSSPYTTYDILHHAVRIVASMDGAEQLLGGYWFLHSYFIAAFLSFAFIWLCRSKLSAALAAVLLLAICVIMKCTNLHIPYYVSTREMMAASFMVIGYAYKHSRFDLEKHPLIIVPLGILLIAFGVKYWSCSMLTFTWQSTIPYAFTAVFGTFMVFSLCKWLMQLSYISKTLTYVGERTLFILTWHLFSFKIVSLIIIAMFNLSMARLAEFPVIEEYTRHGWWIVCIFVGVFFPLLLECTSKQLFLFVEQFSKNQNE